MSWFYWMLIVLFAFGTWYCLRVASGMQDKPISQGTAAVSAVAKVLFIVGLLYYGGVL